MQPERSVKLNKKQAWHMTSIYHIYNVSIHHHIVYSGPNPRIWITFRFQVPGRHHFFSFSFHSSLFNHVWLILWKIRIYIEAFISLGPTRFWGRGGGSADNVNILLSGHFCMTNKRFVELTDKSLSFVDLTDYVRLPAAYNWLSTYSVAGILLGCLYCVFFHWNFSLCN